MNVRLLSVVAAAALAIACGQTDAGITTSIKGKLVADDLVKARQIDVTTENKVVTLTGEVQSTAEEAQALQIARSTDGVSTVVDEIRVVPGADRDSMTDRAERAAGEGTAVLGDAGVTATVKAKLLADPDVSGLRLDVDTKDGVVTLTGNVATQAQEAEALRIARTTDNVRNVVDRITVEGTD
jgi:hyperosmotically inducible protein